MKYIVIAYIFSGAVILTGILNITVGTGLNMGIDFAGGTLIQIHFKNPHPIGKLRQKLNQAGLGESKIQEVGTGENEYIIRSRLPEEKKNQKLEAHVLMGNKIVDILKTEEEKKSLQKGLKDLNNMSENEVASLLQPSYPDRAQSLAEKIVNLRNSSEFEGILQNYQQLNNAGISQDVIEFLQEKTFLGSMAIKRRETVGPQVGRDLRRKATQATVWALIGMLIYIGIRFKFAYGVAAILTLGHDVLITVGLFSLTPREVNLPVIAAILTIVGYSLNDTIVIFDRVRDNLKLLRKQDFKSILDRSINQTLSRSVITSGTTFLTVTALFVFGGPVINDFAFTMMIGVLVGTYSSIYQSCPLLYFWNYIFKPKKGMRK